MNVIGFQMFKVVKAMKNIKKPMNELNWKNGSLFKKVILLKENSKNSKQKLIVIPSALNSERKPQLFSMNIEKLWLMKSTTGSKKVELRAFVMRMARDFMVKNIEEAKEMVEEITEAEIKKAMFNIDNDKDLGPDGFTSCFFKKAWSIMGKDVCSAIKEFFHT
uniref:RNA-directed DNA polymerase, eukaryota, reverse transcriptase zinc-binding domain protein n=1 Tax=Tanacetum cinerariifolium TaxID=118510 RepID=A0A6L2MFJ7_TANCI|nr:RNA-directed DNA polymerase, eukaryota, reverse transcriptase zinc-binding domain protein [Tanacetum cinerariifolium]